MPPVSAPRTDTTCFRADRSPGRQAPPGRRTMRSAPIYPTLRDAANLPPSSGMRGDSTRPGCAPTVPSAAQRQNARPALQWMASKWLRIHRACHQVPAKVARNTNVHHDPATVTAPAEHRLIVELALRAHVVLAPIAEVVRAVFGRAQFYSPIHRCNSE